MLAVGQVDFVELASKLGLLIDELKTGAAMEFAFVVGTEDCCGDELVVETACIVADFTSIVDVV